MPPQIILGKHRRAQPILDIVWLGDGFVLGAERLDDDERPKISSRTMGMVFVTFATTVGATKKPFSGRSECVSLPLWMSCALKALAESM